ncbi:MAG: c-type cytochrome domain-containing protein, partial [Pirellulaceae bacterium]
MKHYLRMISVFLLMAAAVEGLAAEEQPQAVAKIDFVKQVQPLLAARCFKCHGPEKQEGRLRLDAPAIVARGGISGPTIKPGKPLQSLLY